MNFERLTETPPEWTLREVTLRVAQPEEIAAACAALEREHYLGAPRPCNREVVQNNRFLVLADGAPAQSRQPRARRVFKLGQPRMALS